jgi:hypothetical protein
MEENKKMNDASMDGLTSEQVIESREKHGQNLLTPPRRTLSLEALSRKI